MRPAMRPVRHVPASAQALYLLLVLLRLLVCADRRQRVALELLESERVYVSHLSLLLKANISFNGSEAFTCKDKR